MGSVPLDSFDPKLGFTAHEIMALAYLVHPLRLLRWRLQRSLWLHLSEFSLEIKRLRGHESSPSSVGEDVE